MKQILPLMAALCLLTGCAAQSAPSVPASTAPPPTAAPQTLTVYADAAALPALQAYADARGVSLTTTQDAESADLAMLDAPPAGEGWRDLLGDELLSAAASRAGVTEAPAMPCRWAIRCTPTGRTGRRSPRCWGRAPSPTCKTPAGRNGRTLPRPSPTGCRTPASPR